MGKKNKKLKKKKSSLPIAPSQNTTISDANPIDEASATVKTTVSSTKAAHTEQDEAEFEHVKGDVKKILLLLFAIIVVLLVLYFVDNKTHYLSTVGDWFYKVLNIQTQ